MIEEPSEHSRETHSVRSVLSEPRQIVRANPSDCVHASGGLRTHYRGFWFFILIFSLLTAGSAPHSIAQGLVRPSSAGTYSTNRNSRLRPDAPSLRPEGLGPATVQPRTGSSSFPETGAIPASREEMPSQPTPAQSPETSQAMMAALREAGSGAVAPSGYMQTERKGYTFKVGPIPFRIGAGLGFQFNDNIYSSSGERVSDLIVTPQIYLSGGWQITSINSLSLSLGIGYSAYLNNSDLNSVTRTVGLTPGLNTDALSFKMKVGDLYFNFYDRPQVGLNSYDLLTSPSGLFNYSLTNVIGASIFWDLNDLRIDARYEHVNTIPLTSQSASVNSANNPNVQQQDQSFLDSLQNAQDSLTASATLRISDNTSVGLEFAATKFTYAGDFQNNGISYHGGMFVGTQLSQYITLRLAGGYQQMTFDSGGLNQDNSSYSKPYVNLDLHHRVNRFLSHTLTVGNEGDLGATSNSVQTAYITEAVTFQVTKAVTLSMFASYETGKESGGPNAQSLNLLNLGLSTGFNLTKKLQMSLYYQFLMRTGQNINDSQNSTQSRSQVTSNYTQNVFGINFSYEL